MLVLEYIHTSVFCNDFSTFFKVSSSRVASPSAAFFNVPSRPLQGADVNAKDKDEISGLMEASIMGHVDVVKELLKVWPGRLDTFSRDISSHHLKSRSVPNLKYIYISIYFRLSRNTNEVVKRMWNYLR